MNLRLAFMFLLPFLLFSFARAGNTKQSCEDVNYASEMGPVRDQGNMGWCYANASADLLGYYLGVQMTEPISAIQMALVYNYLDQDSALFEGGIVVHTLRNILKPQISSNLVVEQINRGYCPLSLEDWAVKAGKKMTLKDKLYRLSNLHKLYRDGVYDPVKKQAFADQIKMLKEEGSVVGMVDQVKLYDIFEKTKFNEKDFFLYFADLICGNKRKYNNDPQVKVVHRSAEQIMYEKAPSGASVEVTVKNDLFKEMDVLLKDKNIFAINYYSGFLQDSSENPALGEFHTSVVVGRRWVNNQCQYLIRNSWGSACKEPVKSGDKVILGNKYSKHVAECVEGNVWVEQKKLSTYLDSITYINYGEDMFKKISPKHDPFANLN